MGRGAELFDLPSQRSNPPSFLAFNEPACVSQEALNVRLDGPTPDNLEAFAQRVFAVTRVPAAEVTGALMVGQVFGIETADGCFSPAPLPMPKEFGA